MGLKHANINRVFNLHLHVVRFRFPKAKIDFHFGTLLSEKNIKDFQVPNKTKPFEMINSFFVLYRQKTSKIVCYNSQTMKAFLKSVYHGEIIKGCCCYPTAKIAR